MMSGFSLKFLAGCLLLAFGIFLGVDLAEKGTERIYGPLQPKVQAQLPEAPRAVSLPKPAGAKPEAGSGSSVNAGPAKMNTFDVPVSDSPINHVGNKTGDLLQILAYHGVKSVVSLFDGLLK